MPGLTHEGGHILQFLTNGLARERYCTLTVKRAEMRGRQLSNPLVAWIESGRRSLRAWLSSPTLTLKPSPHAMGNRKKKRNGGGGPKPSSNPPRENYFLQIIARYQKPAPAGQLWAKHLEIYRMLHSTEASIANNHRCKIYRDQLESAILQEAVTGFSRVRFTHTRTPQPLYAQGPHPPRPAKLVSKMDDDLANEIFFMMARMLGLTGGRASMFGSGTGTLTEVFGEQLFIAFLEWLLENNRPFFEALEDHRPLKEYTGVLIFIPL